MSGIHVQFEDDVGFCQSSSEALICQPSNTSAGASTPVNDTLRDHYTTSNHSHPMAGERETCPIGAGRSAQCRARSAHMDNTADMAAMREWW